MLPDLTQAAAMVQRGERAAREFLDDALAAAAQPANAHSFIRRFDAEARAMAEFVDAQRNAGGPVPTLAGVAVSVKDLFDVAGHPTTAASRSLHDAAPATLDAPAVARLRAAGAALVGHTNLTEFAFSGVGINPHHGTPPNPATALVDAQPRIPGGSTSGGAVTVATGAAFAALGSDTNGSIRIPAALQGLVGFKSTARLVPTEGCIPLSTTLDTACAITRSVRDAVRLHGVLAAQAVHLRPQPLDALRLAVVRTLMLDGLEAPVAAAFEDALRRLRDGGARIVEIDAAPIAELPRLLAGGGFAPPEAWAWHRRRLGEREALYDRRVALRIRRGESLSAADYIDLLHARRDWIARLEHALAGFDAVLSPTVPMVAPPLQPLIEDDERFFAVNALLLRNTSVVNMADGCALSLPCHAPGTLPVGLMVWSGRLHDERVLGAGLAIEAALAADR